MPTKTLAFAGWTALLLLGGSGCAGAAVTGTAELPAPRVGAVVPFNVASVPTPLAELFGFPTEALTSRASLVRMDDEATCFDVLLRRPLLMPNDPELLPLGISVEIDGAEASHAQRTLPGCAPGGMCLPPDSSLRTFTAEDDTRIRVEGQRLCFASLPRPRREIVLSAGAGKGAWRFRFLWTGEEG